MPTRCINCHQTTLKRVDGGTKVLESITIEQFDKDGNKTGEVQKPTKTQDYSVYKCSTCNWGTTIWQGNPARRIEGRKCRKEAKNV